MNDAREATGHRPVLGGRGDFFQFLAWRLATTLSEKLVDLEESRLSGLLEQRRKMRRERGGKEDGEKREEEEGEEVRNREREGKGRRGPFVRG